MKRVALPILLVVCAATISIASQDVVVRWHEVHLKARLDHWGYKAAEIVARTTERGDVTFIESLSVRLDQTEVACPSSVYSDIRFPRLNTMELTYPWSDRKEDENTLFISLRYVPDPSNTDEESSEAVLYVDVSQLRIVKRRVVKPNADGTLEIKYEVINND